MRPDPYSTALQNPIPRAIHTSVFLVPASMGTHVAVDLAMKTSMKWIALSAAAAGAGAAALGTAHMIRRRRMAKASNVDSLFDSSDVGDISEITDSTDVETPVVVTEEVVVITEPAYTVDIDLIPSDDPRVRR